MLWAAILALAQWSTVGCLSCVGRCQWSCDDLNLCQVGAATSVSQMVRRGPKGLVTALTSSRGVGLDQPYLTPHPRFFQGHLPPLCPPDAKVS